MAAVLVAFSVGGVPIGLDNQGDVETADVAVEQARACGGLCIGGAVLGGIIVGGATGAAIASIMDSGDTSFQYTNADELKKQTYSHADTIRYNSEKINELSGDLAQAQEGVMWSHAKVEVVEALNNGRTLSQAKLDAKAEIDETAADMEVTVLKSWDEATVKTYHMMQAHWDNPNVSNSTIHPDGISGNAEKSIIVNHTYTLYNGSDYDYKKIKWANSTGIPIGYANYPGWIHDKPTSDYSDMKFIDTLEYENVLNNISTRATRVHDNVDTIAENIYANYTQGELNTTDVLSGQELAAQYSTNWNSTGHNAYASGFMASLGLDGNLQDAFKVQLESGATFEGQLFLDEGANLSTISSETKYHATGKLNDPANFTDGETWNSTEGHVWMTHDGKMREITGNFTVLSITDTKTGESLSNTTFTSRKYDGTDVSQLESLLKQLIQDAENVETPSSSGFSIPTFGLGSLFGIPNTVWIVLAALGAFLLMRERGGGSTVVTR